MYDLNDRLDALRDLLYNAPSAEVWDQLCAMLDAWPPETIHVGVDYAAPHLDARWPDELRTPPPEWQAAMRSGAPPPAWSLVRTWDVHLLRSGPNKIATIKVVREHTRVGLKEAKDLVEAAPTRLLHGVSLPVAQGLVRELDEARAQAEARSCHSDSAWAPPPLEEGLFDLLLTQKPPPSGRIEAIKRVRAHTGLGLAEARDAVDGAPVRLLEGVPLWRAESVARALREANLSVVMEPPAAPASDGFLGAIADVRLEVCGPKKINVIKVIREYTGLGLKESKDLSESAPCWAARQLPVARAREYVRALVEAGAQATLVASG